MLVALSLIVIAQFADRLPSPPLPRIPASPALLAALPDPPDLALWVVLLQLVHSLPPRLHDYHAHLSHPSLSLLYSIPDAPDFSLLTLVALPNCSLRDDAIPRLRLPHLVALDLRGCSISSYALVALARSPSCPLRLLSLHGCTSIDDNVFSALAKFPLLSAIDLRFTRCTQTALNASLFSLGFRPSDNNSLFHPAPLSVALCALEKLALAASDPISLYSCPPQSVFRLHIDELDHLPSRPKKPLPVAASSTSIRTTSSAQDTVVFIPPVQGKPPIIALPTDRPVDPSHVSSFYQTRNTRPSKSVLPLSAQAVRSSTGMDPLAVSRSPPPWKILDAAVASHQPDARTGQALNDTLKVDRARLHKRSSDAVADMVHQFTRKRFKIESEFAKAKTRVITPAKPPNPFVKSVFAESSTLPKESTQLRSSRSLPSKTVDVERPVKPLRPITTLKPPILPKELLPAPPPRPKPELKQTRLAFT